MNLLKTAFSATALIFGTLSATGATYKFIAGSTDWTKPKSYSTKLWENIPSDKLPGKDDTVYVTVQEIAIDASDGAVWETINGFGGIAMWYTNSTLVINVPETGAVLDIPLSYKTFNSDENLTRGGIAKRGPGKLKLNSPGEHDYVCNISVEEGDVELQTVVGSKKYHYGKLSVAEGARVFLPVSEPDGNGARTATAVYFWGLSGKGILTNLVAQTLNVSGPFHTVFEGDIWPKAKLYAAANVDIMSENLRIEQLSVHSADLTGNTYLYNPEYETLAGERKCDPAVGVLRFGNAGEPSSIGTNGTITLGYNPGDFNSGGGVRYLGSGEKTTKNFIVPCSRERPAHIDGGPNGGLEIAGEISVNAYLPAWQRLAFKGENTMPCKFTGTVKQGNKNGTNYNFYVTKQGTGTWIFEGKKDFTGGFAVEDGTLMFDSLDEAGVSTSLGNATVLTRDVYDILKPGIFEPYAYVLGGVGSDGRAKGKGLLEYAGSETVRVTTRPAKVNGKGGFANSTGKSFRFADISAMRSGSDDTLVLSGSGTGGNEVQDLSGDLSVVKEGEGTWILSGSNTFSGTIEVKGGTLHVRDSAKYTWYRWVICETMGNSKMETCEFGLYDADGKRVNAGLVKGSGNRKLAPGEAHIDSERELVEVNDSYVIGNAFDDTTASARFSVKDGKTTITPVYADGNTWVSFLMRLPDGSNDVASYDFTVLGKKAGYQDANVKTWKIEASSDGLRWDELVPVTENLQETPEDYNTWWRIAKKQDGGDLKYEEGSAAEHSGGAPLAGRKVSGMLPVLNNVSSVSVASGAVLSTDRSVSPVKLHSLTVDATDAGTIRNFAFAENGVLNVTNLSGVSGEVLLPGEYDNVSGLANVAGWTLNVNGVPSSKLTVSVKGSRIYVQPVGFVFVVR